MDIPPSDSEIEREFRNDKGIKQEEAPEIIKA